MVTGEPMFTTSRRMTEQDRIYIEACADADAQYHVCPFCNAFEKSFSASYMPNSGYLVYNCFRAKCGVSGAIAGNFPYSKEKIEKSKPPIKEFTEPTERIIGYTGKEKVLNYLRQFPVLKISSSFTRTVDDNKLVCRLRYNNGTWGVQVRHMDEKKYCIYPYRGEKYYSVHLADCGFEEPGGEAWFEDTLVITEDYISAECIKQFTNCVSILGTTLTDSALEEIEYKYRYYRPKLCLIWLDGDTWRMNKDPKTAVWNKLMHYFDEMAVVHNVYDKDPKWLTEIEICQVLREYSPK